MNLMKLLSVGQSLDGKKSALGKYKLLRQTSLPKFGSTVRPSKTAMPVSQPATEVPETPVMIEVVAPELPIIEKTIVAEPKREIASAKLEKTQKIPAGTVLKRGEEPVALLKGPSLATRIKNKIAALKKVWFPPRSRKKTGAAPVQTEWALEKICVARNDLNDADLEIVAPKAPALARNPKPNFANLIPSKNTGRAWIKMTARLFKTSSPFEKPQTEKTFVSEKTADRPESELVDRI
jgi:hypothetical protein